MSEMRVHELFMVGRIVREPVQTKDGLVHFMFDGSPSSDPFHCVCQGKTARDLLKYCSKGDEMTLEGKLSWMTFPNSGKILLIFVRYISYGRKIRDLSEGISSS